MYNYLLVFSLFTLLIIINEFLFYITFRRFIIKLTNSNVAVKILKILVISIVFLFISCGLLRLRIPNYSFISLTYNITCVLLVPKLFLFPFFLIINIFYLLKLLIYKFRKKSLPQKFSSQRRKLLSTLAWTGASLPILTAGVGLIYGVENIKRRYYEISLLNFYSELDNFRIVHISDLHFGSFSSASAFQKLCDIINFQLSPDMIFITGDFVNYCSEEMEPYLKLLASLQVRYKKFAILGNHDIAVGGEEIEKLLTAANINVLRNSAFNMNTSAGIIQIVGVDFSLDENTNRKNLALAFDGINEELPCFFLCHNPELWDKFIASKYPADITFAGHTHGGQVTVPLTQQQIFPWEKVFNTDKIHGLYKQNYQYLYVNSGFGTTTLNVRIGTMPEVAIFDVKRTQYFI